MLEKILERIDVFLTGLVVGIAITVAILIIAGPPWLTPDRIRGCQMAGYSTAVADADQDVYCAHFEDMILWPRD